MLNTLQGCSSLLQPSQITDTRMLEKVAMSNSVWGENTGKTVPLYTSEVDTCWNTVLICTREYP